MINVFKLRDPLFISSALDIPDKRQTLTDKTVFIHQYLYTHYLSQFDWFLKADDDTYVIMENLRFLLSHFDPAVPGYIGRFLFFLFFLDNPETLTLDITICIIYDLLSVIELMLIFFFPQNISTAFVRVFTYTVSYMKKNPKCNIVEFD